MSSEAFTINKRSRLRIWVGSTLIIAIGVIALFVGSVVYPHWSSWREIKNKQRALLFETDHMALFSACREVWENRPAIGKNENDYIAIDPSNPKLPPAILALNAHAIDAYASGVNIELGGQGCHYGFEAFFDDKPDENRMVWKNVYPSKELVVGLCYYAENGLLQTK
jgi:hypothetical protein